MIKQELPAQADFNQPISFNFMQNSQKIALQSNKPKIVEASNVFGFDNSSNSLIYSNINFFYLIIIRKQ